MPSLPFGRGSRQNAADAAIARNESFATRAAVAKQFGGAISVMAARLNGYVSVAAGNPSPTNGAVHVVPLGFEYHNIAVNRIFVPGFDLGTKRGARVAIYRQESAASDKRLILIDGSDTVVDDPTAIPLVGGVNKEIAPITVSAGTLLFAAFTQPTAGTAHIMRLCSSTLVFPGRSVVNAGTSFPKEIGPPGSSGVTVLLAVTNFPIFNYIGNEFAGIVW